MASKKNEAIAVQYEMHTGEKAFLVPANIAWANLDTDNLLTIITSGGRNVIVENGKALYNSLRKALNLSVPPEDEVEEDGDETTGKTTTEEAVDEITEDDYTLR